MKLKSKLLRIFGIVLLFACATGLIMLTSFNADLQQETRCASVDIHIDHEQGMFFLERSDIMQILGTAYGDSVKGDALKSIRVGRIESLLEEQAYVEDAETWLDANGNMHIEIVQKQPVVRVINKYGVHYYLDKIGNKIPISDKFTARVPVVTGSIEEGSFNTDMATSRALQNTLKLVNYFRLDPFWNAQIEQIAIAPNGTFTLIPKLGNHKILFGSIANMEEKLNKMKIFYKEGLSHTGWEKYESFKLDFNGQIVCELKSNYEQQ